MKATSLKELMEVEFDESDWIASLKQLLIMLEEAKANGDKSSAKVLRQEIRTLTDEAQTYLPIK